MTVTISMLIPKDDVTAVLALVIPRMYKRGMLIKSIAYDLKLNNYTVRKYLSEAKGRGAEKAPSGS